MSKNRKKNSKIHQYRERPKRSKSPDQEDKDNLDAVDLTTQWRVAESYSNKRYYKTFPHPFLQKEQFFFKNIFALGKKMIYSFYKENLTYELFGLEVF